MEATTPKTIDLDGGIHEEYPIAVTGVLPGQLVALNSDGEVIAQATTKIACERMFLKEDALQGKTITDAYTADNVGSVVIASPGKRVYALVASGETIVIGDQLVASGAGLLIKTTASTDVTLAVALEASGGELAANTRLIVRAV